ncbi:MAG: DUF5009 domain-containing protein [Lewinellaceae bacterium]|nr:DUF5009 domain-containing protein [Lewinellaceae bacterium]
METSKRLLSLDVFRGLTIAGMILVNNPGSWSDVYPPLLHADWHGATPTDWIFPFFLFIVGVSISLALGKRKERGDEKRSIYQKIIYRSAVIFGLGLFLALFPHFRYQGPANLRVIHYILLVIVMVSVFTREVLDQPQYERPQVRRWLGYAALAAAAGMLVIGIGHYDLSHLRIPGVLQRIALVYLVCSFIFMNASVRSQVYIGIGLLLGYWALMTLVPVPGGIAPNLEPDTNLGAWLDRAILGTNHLWSQSVNWDPEGILSTLPAIVTGLCGILTGEWLRTNREDYEKVSGLLVAGAILLAISLTWNIYFPLNKKIWTSSYVLYTAGVALLILGVVYWLVDIKGRRGWIKPFQVYGTNALFAFILSGIIAKLLSTFKSTNLAGEVISAHQWIYQTFLLSWLSPKNASLGYALLNVMVILALTWVLYRKKIFIKV